MAAGSKNEFIHTYFSRAFAYSLSNLAHDLGDCFYKPKLLLGANRLIFLNIPIKCIKNSGSPALSRAIVFYIA